VNPKVYICIGMIGSGKSTFANKMAITSPTLVVSKDKIREMLLGQYRYEETVEQLINKITDDTIANCASEIILGIAPYQSIIIDECNLTRKDRNAYIDLIMRVEDTFDKENFFEIEYVYFPDFDGDGLTRRMNEHRGLGEDHWENVWNWQLRKIEAPTHKEMSENNVINMITINSFKANNYLK
jgi:predicted kinase